MEGDRQQRRPRGALVVAAALSAIAVWAAPAAPAAALPGTPPPPLPTQPGSAAAPCDPAPLGADQWRTVSVTNAPYAIQPNPVPSYLMVDPWNPCHVLSAPSPQAVLRSDDSGASWKTVFHDDESAAIAGVQDPTCGSAVACQVSPPFHDAGLLMTAPQTVLMAESANGDAMVRSDDLGASWSLSNAGLAGQHSDLLAADAGGRTVYAVAADFLEDSGYPYQAPTSSPWMLVSRDSGRTWIQTQFAVPTQWAADASSMRVVDLAVDPGNPGNVFLLVEGEGSPATSIVLGSSDGGASFQVRYTAQALYQQLLATDAPDGSVRLYLPGITAAGIAYSGDGGRTFTPLKSPGLLSAVLASDPRNPDDMVEAGVDGNDNVAAYSSSTGFLDDAGLKLPAPPAPKPPPPTAFWTTSIGFWNSLARSNEYPQWYPYVSGPPERALQVDRDGNFYLAAFRRCGCSGSSPQFWWEVHPHFAIVPPPPPPPSSPGSVSQLTECGVPNPDNDVPNYGNMTFDGQDIVYGEEDYQATSAGPNPADLPYHARLYRITPQSCAAGVTSSDPPLDVAFDPGQMTAMAEQLGYDPTRFAHPSISEIVYDPIHDGLWATLDMNAAGEADSNGKGEQTNGDSRVPIFFITYARSGNPAPARADLRFDVSACSYTVSGPTTRSVQLSFLAYDSAANALYTCVAGNVVGVVHASDGTPVPSCLAAVVSTDPSTGIPANIAVQTGDSNWTFVGADHLYTQNEDDTTVRDIHPDTCRVQSVMTHRTYAEPNGENEQMACDPFTFSAASVVHIATDALWIRDAEAGLMGAYALPAGCPWPTAATATTSLPVAPMGAAVSACAAISSLGRAPQPQSGLVHISLDGVVVGSTPAGGPRCIPLPQNRLSRGTHSVVVSYDGDPLRWLPARAATSLTVGLGGVPPGPAGGGFAAAGPVTPVRGAAPFAAAPEAGPPEVPNALLQSVSQAQGQSSAQAAMMPAAQRQRQVAQQRVAMPQTQRGQQAQTLAAVAVAAAAMLGFMVFLSPRRAFAEARERRRRWVAHR